MCSHLADTRPHSSPTIHTSIIRSTLTMHRYTVSLPCFPAFSDDALHHRLRCRVGFVAGAGVPTSYHQLEIPRPLPASPITSIPIRGNGSFEECYQTPRHLSTRRRTPEHIVFECQVHEEHWNIIDEGGNRGPGRVCQEKQGVPKTKDSNKPIGNTGCKAA